jgi:hypothetical protein
LEFAGFQDDLAEALRGISVCCAPMHDSGGVSTKVLAGLLAGKRTVCSPEAALGITSPPSGLWVTNDADLGESISKALASPWSAEIAKEMREAVAAVHGSSATVVAWRNVIFGSDSRASSKTAEELSSA